MPKLTLYIERKRREGKIPVTELAGKMGISVRTYRRKVNSEEGFTDLEIGKAMGLFGSRVVVLGKEDEL